SVGLNLQVANAVINLDLPWNPARLEQRISRAWRKNQLRSVTVINLITEGSIEHNILHLIGYKQALADGILDGEGDLESLKIPSGRPAFVERMQVLMTPATPAPSVIPAEQAFVIELLQRHAEKILLVEVRRGHEGRPSLLAVVDLSADIVAAERERLPSDASF